MKRLYIVLLASLMAISLSAKGFHHASHVSHVSHPSHSTIHRTSKVTPKALPKVTPRHRQEVHPLWRNGVLVYLICRPKHKLDTYNVKDKEYKLCPKCKKVLIRLQQTKCKKCSY